MVIAPLPNTSKKSKLKHRNKAGDTTQPASEQHPDRVPKAIALGALLPRLSSASNVYNDCVVHNGVTASTSYPPIARKRKQKKGQNKREKGSKKRTIKRKRREKKLVQQEPAYTGGDNTPVSGGAFLLEEDGAGHPNTKQAQKHRRRITQSASSCPRRFSPCLYASTLTFFALP